LNPLKTEIPFARDGLFCPGGVRAKMLPLICLFITFKVQNSQDLEKLMIVLQMDGIFFYKF